MARVQATKSAQELGFTVIPFTEIIKEPLRTSTAIAKFKEQIRGITIIITRNSNGHNYPMGVPITLTPEVLQTFQLLSSMIDRLCIDPRLYPGAQNMPGSRIYTGNNLAFADVEVVIKNSKVSKAKIKEEILKAKQLIIDAIDAIQLGTDYLGYLDVTGKEEVDEKEYEAFKLLKTLDTSAPIADQIKKLLEYIK